MKANYLRLGDPSIPILLMLMGVSGCTSEPQDNSTNQSVQNVSPAPVSKNDSIKLTDTMKPTTAPEPINKPQQSADQSTTTAAEILKPTTASATDNTDRFIYVGYKLYQRVGCMKCHGPTAEGGAAFPNLLESVNRKSKEQIIEITKNGKGIMPPHKDNSYLLKYTKKEGMTVNQGFEAIYAYLSGRSDGKIPPGKLDNPL